MPRYLFSCPQGHESLLWLGMAERDEPQTCPVCGAEAKRGVSAPYLSSSDLAMGKSATSAAIDKWQKQRAEKQKIEERTIKEHGSL